MKIFEPNKETWDSKINFVDENNVFVGFDYSSHCCENFGYFFTKKEPQRSLFPINLALDEIGNQPNFNKEEYYFDINYFRKLDNKTIYCDDGGAVCFKLISDSGPPMYLVLFNVHNGYYGHGFNMKISPNETIKYEGYI